MKTKILTRAVAASVLFTFCANPICYAAYNYNVSEGENGEIIIGEPVKTQSGTSIQKTKYSNSVPISNVNYAQSINTKQAAEQFIDKNQLSESEQADLAKKIVPYEKKNKKILKMAKDTIPYKEFSNETSIDANKIAVDSNYPLSYSKVNAANYSRVIIPLQDGDFVYWHKETSYAAEYDKDNVFKGFIKMQKIDNKTFAFYEYRYTKLLQTGSIDSTYAFNGIGELKHVVLYYNDSPATFVYTKDGKLRCCRIGQKLYTIDLEGVPDLTQNAAAISYYVGTMEDSSSDSGTAKNAGKYAAGVGLVPLVPVFFAIETLARMTDSPEYSFFTKESKWSKPMQKLDNFFND